MKPTKLALFGVLFFLAFSLLAIGAQNTPEDLRPDSANGPIFELISQTRYLPGDNTKSVTMTYPDRIPIGYFFNLTFEFTNIQFATSQLSFAIATNSTTFTFSPGPQYCWDHLGYHRAYTVVTNTDISFFLQDIPTAKVIPYLKLDCSFGGQDINVLNRDPTVTAYEQLYFQLYDDSPSGSHIFWFGALSAATNSYHPVSIPAETYSRFIPESIRHVPQGVEVTNMVYVPSAGQTTLSYESLITITLDGRKQNQYHRVVNQERPLSNDYFGRFEGDSRSEADVEANHVANDAFPIYPRNKPTTTSNFCYKVDDLNLLKLDTLPKKIQDLNADWSFLKSNFPRSGVVYLNEKYSTSWYDMYFTTSGTHLCRMFVVGGITPQTYDQGLPAITVARLEGMGLADLSLTNPTAPITRQSSVIPYPSWYIESFSATSISVTVHLPTYSRGDLVVLSNPRYPGLFDPLPLIVDQSIAPSTPLECIPFTINATHVGWINLPNSFDTIGSSKFSKPITCKITLRALPGRLQQPTRLTLHVIKVQNIPYSSHRAYDSVASYADLYESIDMTRLTPTLIAKFGIRILSANMFNGDGYWYTPRNSLGVVTLNDKVATTGDFTALNAAEDIQELLIPPHNDQKYSYNNDSVINDSPFIYSLKYTYDPHATFLPESLQTPKYFAVLGSEPLNTPLVNNRPPGRRIFSLALSATGMSISGGSIFNATQNSMLLSEYPDYNSNTGYNRPSTSSTVGQTDYPSQPLHLVIDFDEMMLSTDTNELPYNITCYHTRDGIPQVLISALGKDVYVSTETITHSQTPIANSFNHRLFVQLPRTTAGTVVNIRCEFPLPIVSFVYNSTRISYWLQAGTVLETYAVMVYNKNNDVSLLSDLAVLNHIAENGGLKHRALPRTLGSPAKTLVSQSEKAYLSGTPTSVTLLNDAMTFFIDFSNIDVNKNQKQAALIERAKKAKLDDFIIDYRHLTLFYPSDMTLLRDIKLVDFTEATHTVLSEPTQKSTSLVFYLTGSIPLLNDMIYYDEILDDFITALKTTTAFGSLMSSDTNFNPQTDIALVSVVPMFDSDSTDSTTSVGAPTRFAILDPVFAYSDVINLDAADRPFLTGASRLGTVSGKPTRLQVTFTMFEPETERKFSFTNFTNGDYLEMGTWYLKKFQKSEATYMINGLYFWRLTDEMTFFKPCLYNMNKQSFSCGGTCDLKCPDSNAIVGSFRCTRNSDCFHGTCLSEGLCGEPKRLEYAYSSAISLNQNTQEYFDEQYKLFRAKDAIVQAKDEIVQEQREKYNAVYEATNYDDNDKKVIFLKEELVEAKKQRNDAEE